VIFFFFSSCLGKHVECALTEAPHSQVQAVRLALAEGPCRKGVGIDR
jgi:hypothetical protein